MVHVHTCTLKVQEWEEVPRRARGRPLDMAQVRGFALKAQERADATLGGRQGSRMVDIPLPPAK